MCIFNDINPCHAISSVTFARIIDYTPWVPHTFTMSVSVAEKQIELAQAREKLAMFLDAEDRVVRGGQTMTIDDGDMRRTVSRVDVKWLSSRIAFYKGEVNRLVEEIANLGAPKRKGMYVRLM